jgi:DNA-binding XRE family transcriptional regulator
MRLDWLWDRNITDSDVKKILSDEDNDRFVEFAALLLSRKNTPKEIFELYLSQKQFVRNWNRIKRHMRKNAWNEPRIIFWQAVYEKLFEEFKERGIAVRSVRKEEPFGELCKSIGEKLRMYRQKMGLTQNELAQRLGISQQIISRIETGRNNMSVLTLNRIFSVLGEQVVIESRPCWIKNKISSNK